MNPHVKDIGKYAASALLSLVVIIAAGAITTLAVTIGGFVCMFLKHPVGAPHAGAGITVFMTMLFQPVSVVVWIVAGIILPIVYFLSGYKYALKKLIHQVLANKGEGLVYPLLDKFLNDFKQKQPALVKAGTDYSLKKLQLMDSIKQSNGNAMVKHMVVFALKKVKLNDIELNKEGRDFYEVVKLAAFQQLQQVSQPKWWPLGLILTLQWVGLYFIKQLPV